MPFKNLFAIAAENTILIVMKDKRLSFTRENPEFDEIKELIRNEDEKTLVEKLTKGTTKIPEYSNGMFKINGETITDIETGTEVNLVLGRKIIEWSKEGLPFEPLLKFHRKIIQNPNKDSAIDLYSFLTANKISITDEGNFIAYKKVKYDDNGVLVDCYTGKIDNSVGNIVVIDRAGVDKNRMNTCSTGLHCAGFSYMNEYSGDVVVEVEVEPQDVVAVPPDYNQAKMRVCRYKVLCISGGSERVNKLVKVKKVKVDIAKNVNLDGKIDVSIKGLDLNAMTAQKIKEYMFEEYGVNMLDNNKNKKNIVKKAYKIISEK